MSQANDLSRSLVSLEQDATLVAVIELSQSSWLIAGTVPGIERQPLKKIVPDEAALLRLLHRWRDEAIGKGRTITRIAVAFDAHRHRERIGRSAAAHHEGSAEAARAAA
jgi:transposase